MIVSALSAASFSRRRFAISLFVPCKELESVAALSFSRRSFASPCWALIFLFDVSAPSLWSVCSSFSYSCTRTERLPWGGDAPTSSRGGTPFFMGEVVVSPARFGIAASVTSLTNFVFDAWALSSTLLCTCPSLLATFSVDFIFDDAFSTAGIFASPISSTANSLVSPCVFKREILSIFWNALPVLDLLPLPECFLNSSIAADSSPFSPLKLAKKRCASGLDRNLNFFFGEYQYGSLRPPLGRGILRVTHPSGNPSAG
mmetsp:Transcript_19313/g.34908  ORF Transcript_19313/g.34908 Transcript_19313/m.34908 type:complete len:258 (+) Transcript_19313:255-1028(+)